MSESLSIPLFPLSILPLPGELVPLHIFEPRYKQLLADLEERDIKFGIYFNHTVNENKIGSIMKLESVVKRYKGGEADIIVRCLDNLSLEKMYRTYRDKLYPGGEVKLWETDLNETVPVDLYQLFIEFQKRRNISHHHQLFPLYNIAAELSLDIFDRYKFLNASSEKKLIFLSAHLKFNLHILAQEEKSKDLYFLN